MAVPSSPASDFCAACGFPLRGPRCEACGVDRSPAISRKPPPADADWDGSSIEAWRARDPVRFVSHCASAEAGTTVQATTLQDGVGWIVPLGAATLFVALDAANERVSIDVPVARVAERQRVPLLRAALELSGGPEPFRLCLRDDLLLLRRVGRVAAFTPEALRQALRESGEAAQRLGATMAAWFDARQPFSEEQRASLTWASAGRARPLKSFSIPPAPGRPASAPSVRAVAPPPPISAVRTPHEEHSAWAAPPLPRLPESVARPIRDADVIPDILSPSLASVPAPTSMATSARNGGAPPAKAGILPPAHDGGAASKSISSVAIPGPEAGAAKPASATAAPLSGEHAPAADTPAQIGDRRSARTVPFRRSNSSVMAAATTPVSVRPPALPEVEIDPPSRQNIPSRPESTNTPADRFCQLLRDAQVLGAALSFQERPGVMVLLIRCTVFRAIYEYGDTMPDAVAHLYRCTAAATRELIQAEGGARRGGTAGVAEPAFLAMERLVTLRGQVAEEKPLHVDPLTTAALAREHLGRYLREIERAPADPMLRHFLAIGALSELLVRTKLPLKTEQRLRDIVAYAQRDGAKPGTIDLLMTALSRIVAQ
ncbi:zinc ribbon domain-containing protein [Sorangium cellulosum]|uniref:zinc ribbon domain-containing protein n=1 Tax=Sorangium cellulosum TaxID=56 RepID=UPI0012DB55EA|nr:zinc ribbon domain-containing protein [Sorangium cellulosum]